MILRRINATAARTDLWKTTVYRNINRTFSDKVEYPRKIFSGVQPTGGLHIGNYLGAIKQWVDLQNSGENVTYCIVDLHSITLPQDPKSLRQNTITQAATLLGCGIDPQKATLFIQSQVRQHAELGWILGCLTTMAQLSHFPQYKEKSKALKDIPLGLYIYPILQAADILAYKATHVPVGEDQAQHLQHAQYLAKAFNTKFGQTFPACHAMIQDDAGSRIKSLRDPSKKMSKSDPDPKATIMMTDSADAISGKIKKAVTDFTSQVTFAPEERPGVANLLGIHSLLTNSTIEEICEENSDVDTGKYKLRLADVVVSYLNPIRKKVDDLLKHPEYLEQILKSGAEKAGECAEKTLVEVKSKVGLGF